MRVRTNDGERFNAAEFTETFSEAFGRWAGIGAAIVVVLFLAFVALAMGVAAWHFFVHQLQR